MVGTYYLGLGGSEIWWWRITPPKVFEQPELFAGSLPTSIPAATAKDGGQLAT